MLYFLPVLPPSLIFKSTSAQSNDTVRIVAVKRCTGQDGGGTFSGGGGGRCLWLEHCARKAWKESLRVPSMFQIYLNCGCGEI